MALQDIAARESVLAKVALVGSFARVCCYCKQLEQDASRNKLTSQKMALQMLQVEVRLVAMRTLVFTFCVLGGVRDGFADCRAWAARVGGKHATATLLADNVHGFRVLVGEDGLRMGVHAHAHATGAHILQSSRERVLTQRVGMRTRGGQERGLGVGRGSEHVRGRGLQRAQWGVLGRDGRDGGGGSSSGGRGVRGDWGLRVAAVVIVQRGILLGAAQRRQGVLLGGIVRLA